ncbi:hypothetical protein EUX98_g3279 [Antrodiella citrinella]|uniref:non-specific serine/threonine protein kinase n=1 Tax=Antrodiella citrinella TaxID=2447956 RepID=A0A4S4MZ17_9APHY|nr:hypothetical protein EUX98_g3279 [Antrodiella citrinella]
MRRSIAAWSPITFRCVCFTRLRVDRLNQYFVLKHRNQPFAFFFKSQDLIQLPLHEPETWPLQWDGGDGIESGDSYRPGGLHPVRLGDIMESPIGSGDPTPGQRRYRIVNKLGRGAYSTVWLAQVLDAPTRNYAALKIRTAKADPQHELSVFKRVGSHPNIMRLRDSFFHSGPNGVHTVLVHDVLGSLLDVVDTKGGRKYAKTFGRQIAQGLAFLHGQGVVHGGDLVLNVPKCESCVDSLADIHGGNLGVCLPTLSEHDLHNILNFFGEPNGIIVFTRASSSAESFPPYLLESTSIIEYIQVKDPSYAAELLQAQIVDLGNGQ